MRNESVPVLQDTCGHWLRQAAVQLREVADNPRVEAELILATVLARAPTAMLTAGQEALTDPFRQRATGLLARRCRGEPMAYLLGEKEFWSLPLTVTSAVLVPRPETEGVVSRALELLEPVDLPRVLDLGTGSGAIALAIARERPEADVIATDVNASALAVARRNGERHGLNVRWLVGDWYAPLTPRMRFDLIAANPPYIERGDAALEPDVACHEPAQALYAGHGGLASLETIIAGAPAFLQRGGHLVLEHGATQGTRVCELLERAGFLGIRDDLDLAGLARVASGRWPEQLHG